MRSEYFRAKIFPHRYDLIGLYSSSCVFRFYGTRLLLVLATKWIYFVFVLGYTRCRQRKIIADRHKPFIIATLMYFLLLIYITEADPGFQVRGGRTKKNCAEQREARKFLGYFVWKFTILRQKIIFFPMLGWRAPGAPPPESTPGIKWQRNASKV